MRQVFDLVDRIVVFRRGKICANLDIKNDKITGEDVVGFITGAKTQEEYS
jgi:fructose transport system ATP-binding protein